MKPIKTNLARHMVVTQIARVSFPQLFTPRSFKDNPEAPKYYSVDLIFDSPEELKKAYAGSKTKTVSVMDALKNVCSDQWGPDKSSWPKFEYPALKKGNDRIDSDGQVLEGYKDKVYITAKTDEKHPPRIVGPNNEPLSENEMYGGCFARAQLLVRPYKFAKFYGVKFNLLGIQKVQDGDKFGLPSDVFDTSDTDSNPFGVDNEDDSDDLDF